MKNNKLKMILSICIMLVGVATIAEAVLAYEYLPHLFGIVLVVTGTAVFIISLVLSVAFDYSSGEFECRRCGHTFVPTLGAYIWGVHTLTTRRLKCPECGKKSYCKRKFRSEK